ncbi:MAG: FHA domain-containing protein [Spirochaetales bacterium]|nr:FHA domain-containing protein [Spirochaetales bacterium]
MNDITVISRKTPKTRRPVTRNEYTLTCSVRKTPYVLSKTKKFSIGRLKKNDISLPQKTTSDVHATVKWSKSSFRITDENSTNCTYVNGKRIEGTTALADGDKIKIGKFTILFRINKVREKLSQKAGEKKTAKAGPKKTVKAAPKKAAKAGPETGTKAAPKKAAKTGPKTGTKAAPKKAAKASPKKTAKAGPKAGVKKTARAGSHAAGKTILMNE